jgi:hypothetical protein
MFLDVKEYVTGIYLQGQITRGRADEILAVISFESKKIKSEHEFQEMIERLIKTQFPELKGFFTAYKMKAGEWLDSIAVDRIDKLIDQGKLQEAEMVMGVLEEMEETTV